MNNPDISRNSRGLEYNRRDEDSLEDQLTGFEDFEVTLRIHDSTTPEPTPTIGDGDGTAQMDGLGLGDIPHIAVTPMTPPSGSVSPLSGHSTVSLNSSCGSPFHHPRDLAIGPASNATTGVTATGETFNANPWRSESPLPPQSETEAKDFFAYRDSILNHVVDEIKDKGVDIGQDGCVKGTWLLTEIDSWNHEYERIVVLCDKALIVIKYDFIGMKVEDTRRLSLSSIDKVVQGDLAYPQNSLTPKLNGIAEGIAGVVKECIIPTVHGTVQTVGSAVWRKSRCTNPSPDIAHEATEELSDNESRPLKGSIMSVLSLEKFESKSRNTVGVQLIWDENQPMSFHQRWNPFDKSFPRLTLTSHPLFWHKGGAEGSSVALFDVESFTRELTYALGQGNGDLSPSCRIEYKPIVIESYVGIASLLYNANSLGFYKVRGRVSF